MEFNGCLQVRNRENRTAEFQFLRDIFIENSLQTEWYLL